MIAQILTSTMTLSSSSHYHHSDHHLAQQLEVSFPTTTRRRECLFSSNQYHYHRDHHSRTDINLILNLIVSHNNKRQVILRPRSVTVLVITRIGFPFSSSLANAFIITGRLPVSFSHPRGPNCALLINRICGILRL